MANFNELSQHYIKEIEHYLALSQALLQKGNTGGNLSGSLKTGGDYLEQLAKSILRRFLPNHFRIVSGYIATPEIMKSDSDLPQFDIVIVDNRIPPLMTMKDTDIEVNAIEGVCGVIEVKRTLTDQSLLAAIDQIQKAVEIGLKKDIEQENLVNLNTFGSLSIPNPLFGIISIQSDLTGDIIMRKINDESSLLDFVRSLDGKGIAPILISNNTNYTNYIAYIPYARNCSWNNFKKVIDGIEYSGAFMTFEGENGEQIVDSFRKMIGFVNLFMHSTMARLRNDQKIIEYYFK